MLKRISVIVPVYNTEKYLRKCLNSLIAQTFNSFEIIVINDGSTDNSLNILEEYAGKYPDKIILINSQNQGAGKARNLGLDIASGSYIWFVDSDDWIKPNSLSKMYNLAQNFKVSLVTCNYQMIYNHIKLKRENNNFTNLVHIDKQPDYITRERPCIGNKLFKRELIGDLRFSNNKWEDLAIIPALVADSKILYHTADIEYNYRVWTSNTTVRDMIHPNPRIIEIFNVLNLLEQNFKNRDLYEQYYEQLKSIYCTNILRRTADIATWLKLPYEYKKLLVNYMINMIEIKYSDFNLNNCDDLITPFNSFSQYMLKNHCLNLLDGNLRHESSEEVIKENIAKLLK